MWFLQIFTLIKDKLQKQMLFFFFLSNLLPFFFYYIRSSDLDLFTITPIHLELPFFLLLILHNWYP
ncbi:uncharacterized protein BX664DRAFT_325688 [Halteromyces radiatus]|uniref:uncharacterized protein n=1 Tax=Halteromyces radiatus TaxID=101107 RepID=UPI00221F7A63|nr:uncharacterized protein BX664DRAFT_325688 [Halteromyces radiatus]KAI8097162.1 hypothetical protein BX664DRAFT_325688 [Halteromyces radiatus]